MPTIIGFDTETMDGPPITVQFYSEHEPRFNKCIFVNEKNVLQRSLNHLARNARPGKYAMVGHNLKFDLLSMFYPCYHELVLSKFGDFEFTFGEWEVFGVYGTPTFCRLRKGDIEIAVIDSFSWFRTSLAKAADLVCPHLPKLEMPEGLGTRKLRRNDKKDIAYAMRDAEIAFHLGCAIDKFNQEYDIGQPVSVADMASRIFQRHYIDQPIFNIGPRILEGAVKSYHGGKNNVVTGATPAWHSHVDAWDLSSAYPHAMCQLPAFSKGSLFAAARVFSNKTRRFPEHGVYCVTGRVPKCDWPVIFDHSFKPISGEFANIWVTGYELNEARRSGEIRISKVWGHIYDTDKDPVTVTPFQRYSNEFYNLKQTAEDPVRRFMFKTLCNSLYGKLIQSREVEDENGGNTWKHGPLFHPFAASLVTGHTRSVMHRLEHETQALHTATDGIFCGAGNSPKNGFPWAPQSGLGSIENEGSDCDLLLLRNKLYILYGRESEYGLPSAIKRGWRINKYAKHGFQGSINDLERLVSTENRAYSVTKPNTLRTAVKQNLIPNKFEEKEFVLNVAPVQAHYNHAN